MNIPLRLPMALTALRNLFVGPATRRYPDEPCTPVPGARGELAVDIASCVFCGICARRCPCGAIDVSREGKVLAVEHLRCTSCGVCVDACNKRSLSLSPEPLAVQIAPERHHRVEYRQGGGAKSDEAKG
jgi:ech hydrogenase subunit F